MTNFMLRGYGDKVKYARFLHDGSEIKIGKPQGHWVQQETIENDINLLLPIIKPNVEIPVIELFLK
jgi:alpha-L-fucosidase